MSPPAPGGAPSGATASSSGTAASPARAGASLGGAAAPAGTKASPSGTGASSPTRTASGASPAAPAGPARKPDVRKPEAKKLEAKKPEPKPAERPPRRAPPERVARASGKAQPIDPYAQAAGPALGPPGPPSRADDRNKPDPAAAYRAGIQQYARGDNSGALATFRASAAATPGFAPTWRGLGLVYEKLGNKGMARLAFKRYLQLAPGAGDAEQIRDRMERLGS